MTKSEEIAALVTEAAREGSYPTDVANLAIQKFMEWEKKHYDIYPKDAVKRIYSGGQDGL